MNGEKNIKLFCGSFEQDIRNSQRRGAEILYSDEEDDMDESFEDAIRRIKNNKKAKTGDYNAIKKL